MRFLPEISGDQNPPPAKPSRNHSAAPMERLVWTHLRAHVPAGLKIKRRLRVGPYQVAFACPDMRLILDLDEPCLPTDLGGVRRRQRRDYLTMQGYHVVTLERGASRQEMADVLDVVTSAVSARSLAPG